MVMLGMLVVLWQVIIGIVVMVIFVFVVIITVVISVVVAGMLASSVGWVNSVGGWHCSGWRRRHPFQQWYINLTSKCSKINRLLLIMVIAGSSIVGH